MSKKYAAIIKTGDAEFRALENLTADYKKNFLPIIEITRGRKLPEKEEEKKANRLSGKELYPFAKRIEILKQVLGGYSICLDLTSDSNLTNTEIDKLYNPENGYQNWIDFLVSLKEEGIFKKIIPCIILNVEDPDFDANLLKQVRSLKKHFNRLLYRNSLFDENCYSDFELLKSEIDTVRLYVLIDCGYVLPAAHKSFSDKAKARVANLREKLASSTKYIISATSYPKTISDIGHDYSDTFRLVELDIFNEVASVNSTNLIYGDYATINPIRNDTITMARGWIPRIDIALKDEIYYYRKRRPKGITQYAATYIDVAKLVVNDSRFPLELNESWAVQEILKCAKGKPSNTSPNFWISVRMNMHLQQQIERTYYAKE